MEEEQRIQSRDRGWKVSTDGGRMDCQINVRRKKGMSGWRKEYNNGGKNGGNVRND